MPAKEETWRDMKKLHRWFAGSSVALLLATLWMFVSDHSRSWKTYQKTARNIDIQMTQWRRYQYETDEWHRKKDELETQLQQVRSQPLDAETIAAFQRAVEREIERLGQSRLPDWQHLDSLKETMKQAAEQVQSLSTKVREADNEVERLRLQWEEARAGTSTTSQDTGTKRPAAADLEAQLTKARQELAKNQAELDKARQKLLQVRSDIVAELRRWVRRAQFNEELQLQRRKFKAADVDAQRAKLDIAIRDNRSEDEIKRERERLDQLTQELDTLTLNYQAAAQHRRDIQQKLQSLTQKEDELHKQLEQHLAQRQQLEKSLQQKRSTFFVSWILPGKKWLELPILDAFNSPLKIDNLWSQGLEENYNHRYVRRFDRCTTCHKGIDKTLPGSATRPAYPAETRLDLVFDWSGRSEGSSSQSGSGAANGSDGDALYGQAADLGLLERQLGLRLADAGLIRWSDVTVAFVQPGSAAAEARPATRSTELPAADLRRLALQPRPFVDPTPPPGFQVGDVIEEINGSRVISASQAAFALLRAYQERRPLRVTVRRGLPHPYASHPRLDLFVGSTSPHKMAEFACTVCHDGQGSATEFKWASHSPNTPDQRIRWVEEHGWFDNHHWVYPMFPRRFAESACLKCHHDVTELEPSERFEDPPAPKLVHGYHLIVKYGCYGCHEIPGSDGRRRIGPDLRLEPNYFAVALQLKADPSYAQMTADEKHWLETIIYHPEDSEARQKLYQALINEQNAQRFTDTAINGLAPLLRDVDSPGQLRRVGPSLRFVAHKLDDAFLYQWIREPKQFRPDTRMPQFFGLWNHLADDESLRKAQRLEPIEILGIVTYLRQRTQSFQYVERPTNITPSSQEEKIARGKIAFQMRGCLACHQHKDFPEVEQFRAPDAIRHAPDLSNLGDKLDPQRNPRARDWLYTWLKDPMRYHARTFMPDLYLDPEPVKDATGNVVAVYDPAEDITEYLLASRGGWQPAADTPTALTDEMRKALDELTLEHLKGSFYVAQAERYIRHGIPEDRAAELKGAERELLVPKANYQSSTPLSDEQKLLYIGRKSIAKYGCFGCHDIPGFEDAKPIGTPLSDWGRKDPARLAFEHIAHYVEGHGKSAKQSGHGDTPHPSGEKSVSPGQASAHQERLSYEDQQSEAYYREQLLSGSRIGFLYQKLKEPRSYDYDKTLNKSYNDRLRMPQFPFTMHEREAIMTFVLGLVAEPPSEKYIYKPNARTKAILEGKRVLEKYNCAGCHILQAERWQLAYRRGTFGQAPAVPGFDFTFYHPTSRELEESKQVQENNLLQARLEGLPMLDNDGLPLALDSEGEPLFPEEKYNPQKVNFSLMLLKPAILEGEVFQVQQGALPVQVADIARRYPAEGGDLTRYLLPHVVAYERQTNPNLKASESWGWLPPPLVGEGLKVRPDWLHSFLLKPYRIRPAVVMRMPRFNLSSQEATQLVDYFAAFDRADFPYEYVPVRQPETLEQKDRQYREKLQQAAGQQESETPRSRFADAMRVITNSQYCVQCHIVGDYNPTKEQRGKGPNLAAAYQRLRADYLRRWVARPAGILPYTGMPVVFTDNPDQPGGTNVPQSLYHGTSLEQLDAVVDLLVNYDQFAAGQFAVTPLVKAQQPTMPPSGQEAASPGSENAR